MSAGIALRGQPPVWLTVTALLKSHGKEWFETDFLMTFHPVMMWVLLLTLVLILAFQADKLTKRWFAVIVRAIPILVQVYCHSSLTYLLMRWLKVPHNAVSPGARIGASNFFELAVAVVITRFGPGVTRRPGLRGGRAGGCARDTLGGQGLQRHARLVPAAPRRNGRFPRRPIRGAL